MKLIVSNSRTEEMVGDLSLLSESFAHAGGWGAQRMLWFAKEEDIIVLPWLPGREYIDYVTGLTGVNPDTLQFVVPPDGDLGTMLLTPDRLSSGALIGQLQSLCAGRCVDSVISCYEDHSIIDLAAALGVQSALPGYAFSAQGGVALVNSKAAFRAVAAGAGVPIAPGVITRHRRQAEGVISDILRDGHPVILKKEFGAGGFGNEILAPASGVEAAGAKNVVVLTDDAALTSYLDDRWDWLNGGRDDRLVIERYFAGSTTIYAEYSVGYADSELLGTGQILMEPVAAGEIVPPPTLDAASRTQLLDGGYRLCEAWRGLGYRGNIAADAILTSDGEILFSETNGRLTGSTHLHTVIRHGLVDGQLADSRTLLERDSWPASSFDAAVRALQDSGLAYDRATSTGVVLTANYVPVTGAVMYCIVAEDVGAARVMQDRLLTLKP